MSSRTITAPHRLRTLEASGKNSCCYDFISSFIFYLFISCSIRVHKLLILWFSSRFSSNRLGNSEVTFFPPKIDRGVFFRLKKQDVYLVKSIPSFKTCQKKIKRKTYNFLMSKSIGKNVERWLSIDILLLL